MIDVAVVAKSLIKLGGSFVSTNYSKISGTVFDKTYLAVLQKTFEAA